MEASELADVLQDHPRLGALDTRGYEALAAVLRRLEFAPGEELIEEGAFDRYLYLMLRGEVEMLRGGLNLGVEARGGHFGELALLGGGARAAAVVARTPVAVAQLSPEGLEALVRRHPHLALNLVSALVTGVGTRLRGVTDTVGGLLVERSLPRRTQLRLVVDGVPRLVPMGTPARALLPEAVDGHPVIAALVERSATTLSRPLTCDGTVTPLTTAHWEGRRILRRSLVLLLVQAAHEAGLSIQRGHSVGVAEHIRVEGAQVTPELAASLEARMQALCDEDRPLRTELWRSEEALAFFEERGLHQTAALLSTLRQEQVPLVSYGIMPVIGTGPLVERTGLLRGFRIVADEGSLLLLWSEVGDALAEVARQRADIARRVKEQTGRMSRSHLRWLSALGVRGVGSFNRVCIDGKVAELIRVAEGAHEKCIGAIADTIAARDGVRVVCIAGPSSSGKSTFIKRLKVQLQVDGLNPIGLSLDEYFVDRDDSPRDASGALDFEALETLRLDLLGDHLERLLAGERVRTPRYDFVRGRGRPEAGPELQLSEGTLLLLEGIHGLNPALLPASAAGAAFRIFLCPLQQLPLDETERVHASDIRLLRRIVRDRHSRATAAAETIERWPSVRRGERRNIFPFQGQADAVFDSSLVYEPSVLRVYAERYLLEVPRSADARVTSDRLLRLLDRYVSIYPDHVPPTSILREFIGGSGFEY